MSDGACPSSSDPQELLREKVLADAPRLGPDDSFQFACHPGVPCFNRCCADVNIFLAPYDVLRMKKRLGLTSTEFLERYALMPIHKTMKTPTVVLRMSDDEGHRCPFVGASGCTIYSDRPWPCRMYPLGLAAQADTPDGWQGDRFYFLLKEDVCCGHQSAMDESPSTGSKLPVAPSQTVRQWFESQGIEDYDRWGEAFKELTLHKFFTDGGEMPPAKLQMMFTACYDLDKFRQFVFESTLLERFDVDEDFVEDMRRSDDALLRFAFLWLRYSLFGERTMKARPEAVAAIKGRIAKENPAGSGQEAEVQAKGGAR